MSDFGHIVVFMRFKFTVRIFGFFHPEESLVEKVIRTRIQYFQDVDWKKPIWTRSSAEVLPSSLGGENRQCSSKVAVLVLSKTSSIVCISTDRHIATSQSENGQFFCGIFWSSQHALNRQSLPALFERFDQFLKLVDSTEGVLIASFAGDGSYGSSSAATAVSVGPAPATAEPQPQIAVPDCTMAILGVGVAVIIAVAIVGIVLYRKK